MPAQRKPSALQERKGAFRKDPQRRRRDPKGKGALPANPPRHLALNEKLAETWREVVAWLPAGIATGSDRFVVERLVRLLHRSRSRGSWKAADESQLRAYLNALGLSPAARANLAGAGSDKPPENPFARFGGARDRGTGAALPN
jgi:phage terminase small subunit